MFITNLGLKLAASIVLAFLLSFAMTPIVKNFAMKVGAIDVPTDERRMHRQPIPRLGGLAIFIGFLLSVVLFADLTKQVQGILVGAIIVAALGAVDDLISLKPIAKLLGQSVAAVVAISHGVIIHLFTNPNIFSADPYWELGVLSIPVTVIWIVAITNAVNLIDGLDGLACGVSTISSLSMLVIALVLGEGDVAIFLAALAGGCVGFLPYNLNPAKIFMGDTGSTFLGFVLAVVSIQGMFKMYSVISFVVPFLMLGLPIFDTAFAFIRRIAKGQSPMRPDRSHVHHRLIDMGFSQKQAVAVLYVISAILGLSAVVLTTSGPIKAMLLLLALCAAGGVAVRIFMGNEERKQEEREDDRDE